MEDAGYNGKRGFAVALFFWVTLGKTTCIYMYIHWYKTTLAGSETWTHIMARPNFVPNLSTTIGDKVLTCTLPRAPDQNES